MESAVGEWVLEVEEGGSVRRQPLAPGLTRVGGPGCEVALARAGADQLHVWDDPPKLVFVGKGERPRVEGQAVDELALGGGERIEWQGATLRLTRAEKAGRSSEPAPAAVTADEPAWTQVKAGMLFELGLADKELARRWQQAVARGQFDADACARELVRSSRATPGDRRVLERSTRLLRELLMGPGKVPARSSARTERKESRSLLALIAMQVTVILSQIFLFTVVLVVVRWRWGWSIDGFIDQLLERLRGGTS
jgi:hypothetical protein